MSVLSSSHRVDKTRIGKTVERDAAFGKTLNAKTHMVGGGGPDGSNAGQDQNCLEQFVHP